MPGCEELAGICDTGRGRIMTKYTEKKLASENIYKGIVFDVVKDKVELSNGLIRNREIVKHNGGVVILAEKDNKILMVKQYRYAVGQALYELPAGKLDKENEDILSAAKRELLEETGHSAKDWKSLGFIFPTPGFCDEKLHLFYATNLTFDKPNPDEGEIIEHFEVELNKVFEMIKSGEIVDSKSICALMKAYKL